MRAAGRRWGRGLKAALRWLVIVATVAVLDFAVLNTLLTSFKADAVISASPPVWVFEPVLTHYRNVFAGAYPFPSFFANSLAVSAGASALTLVAAFTAAYAIARRGAGRAQLLPLVVSLRLMPPIVFAIPMFVLFQGLRLLDTRMGLILANSVANLPLALLILSGFIQDVPREVEEAARLDGCTTFGILWKVLLPLTLPGVATAGILAFLWSWNEYLFGLMLTIRRATPVTVGASLFVTAWGIRWGDIAAAISAAVVPTLALTFFVQRYLVRGLSLGAVR